MSKKLKTYNPVVKIDPETYRKLEWLAKNEFRNLGGEVKFLVDREYSELNAVKKRGK